MMRSWTELPANAKAVVVVESCIDYLRSFEPYPPNMKADRLNFAAARLGYSAAIYQLEKFMAEITEEIEIEVLEMEAK